MSSSYIVIGVILVIVGIACIISDKKQKVKKEEKEKILNERLESIENRISALENYNDNIQE